MTDLTGLHPDLLSRIKRVLGAMATLGFPMKVVQGVRTAQEQQTLYAQGRTTPGPNVRPGRPLGDPVTNCDGVVKKSRHQIATDGYGHAVDCAFDAADPFAGVHPWGAYGACVKAVGLTWGGDFHSPVDRPHAELP